MDDSVEQADSEAILLMEAWTLGLHNPAIWDKYVTKWTENVERRIDDRFGRDQGTAGPIPG